MSGAGAAGTAAARGGEEATRARALVRPRSSGEEKFQKNCLSLNSIPENLKHFS